MSEQKTRIIVLDGSSVTRAILTRILQDEVHNAEVYALRHREGSTHSVAAQ